MQHIIYYIMILCAMIIIIIIDYFGASQPVGQKSTENSAYLTKKLWSDS